MKISLVGAEVFHKDERMDGETHRHDEANSRFSQFFERAYKSLMMIGSLKIFPVIFRSYVGPPSSGQFCLKYHYLFAILWISFLFCTQSPHTGDELKSVIRRAVSAFYTQERQTIFNDLFTRCPPRLRIGGYWYRWPNKKRSSIWNLHHNLANKCRSHDCYGYVQTLQYSFVCDSNRQYQFL
jgi:hypothetical protein